MSATSSPIVVPSLGLAPPGSYVYELPAYRWKVDAETWLTTGTPVLSAQAMTGGGVRINPDDSGDSFFFRFKGTGAGGGDPTGVGTYSLHNAPTTLPWAMRAVASIAPGSALANEVIWLCGLSQSDTGIGAGVGQLAGGLIWRQGHLYIHAEGTDIESTAHEVQCSWTDEGRQMTHVFDLEFNGSTISAYVDGALVGQQAMLEQWPTGASFMFWGAKNGSSFDNAFAPRFNYVSFGCTRDEGFTVAPTAVRSPFTLAAGDVGMIFGDSITARDCFGQIRTDQLARTRTATGAQSMAFFIDGIPGDLTSNGASRVAAAIAAKIPRPNKLIVYYGTNDFGGGAGGLAAFTTNYAALLDNAIGAGMLAPNILCVGIMGNVNTVPPAASSIDSYNSAIQTAAAARGCTYVDTITPFRSRINGGGTNITLASNDVHPDDVLHAPENLTGKQIFAGYVAAGIGKA